MKLYHFLTAEHALDDLRRRRLKISRLLSLNDPLEFTYFGHGDDEAGRAMRHIVGELSERMGIICFSEQMVSPVMWSHYADRHRGVCLGFELPERGQLMKVRYKKERDLARFARQLGPLTVTDVRKLYATKYEDWKYEREVRIFPKLIDAIRDGDLFFEEFSEELQLVEVIVGAHSVVTRAQVDAALGGLGGVSVCKARPMLSRFAMERDPVPFG